MEVTNNNQNLNCEGVLQFDCEGVLVIRSDDFSCVVELISGEVSCVITRPEQNSNDDEKNDFHDGWLVTLMKSLEVTNNNPQR